MSFILRAIASFLSKWRTFIHFLIPLNLHIDAIPHSFLVALILHVESLPSHEDRECMKGERDLPTSIPLLSRTIVHYLAPSASIYGLESGRVFSALSDSSVPLHIGKGLLKSASQRTQDLCVRGGKRTVRRGRVSFMTKDRGRRRSRRLSQSGKRVALQPLY